MVSIELTYTPGCPHVDRVRARLLAAMSQCGFVDVPPAERYDASRPSPTVLIDGTDVIRGTPSGGPGCRLELPTRPQIVAALRQARIAPGPHHKPRAAWPAS